MSAKLPDGEAREVTMVVRVRPSAAARFKEVAANRGMSASAAMREALAAWIKPRKEEL